MSIQPKNRAVRKEKNMSKKKQKSRKSSGKNFTTEEVILGLECCSAVPLVRCEECPFVFSTTRCDDLLMKEALTRIRRQKDVIAKLEELINKKE